MSMKIEIYDTTLRAVGAPGAAEGVDARVPPATVGGGLEEGDILGIRAGPAALYVVDAQRIEPFGDAQLVAQAQIDPLALGAIAQGRVVDLDLHAHRVIRLTTSSPISLVCRNGALAAAMSRVRQPASSVCSTADSTARASSSSPKE